MAPSTGWKSGLQSFIVLALLSNQISYVYSVPLSVVSPGDPGLGGACAKTCSAEDARGWDYAVGQTYVYDYQVETETAMRGTSDQTSFVTFGVKATIAVKSPCNFQLRLEDVTLNGKADNTGVFSAPLDFAFVKGQVNDLCPAANDDLKALNVKRGVLSAFQAQLDLDLKNELQEFEVSEVDVVGVCETTYDLRGEVAGADLVVSKVKDMKTCVKNQKLNQLALNVPDVNLQHLPLLQSTHECSVGIRDNKLKFSECLEVHTFKPFSSSEGKGAITEQRQTLRFVSEEKSQLSNSIAKPSGTRTTLLYDHETEVVDSAASVLKANQILDSFLELPEESRPRIFIELAHELRKLHFVELYDFFMSIEDLRVRRFALDAVPLLKTDAGVDFMLDRIKSDELDDEKRNRWFYSLNFYKNPTKYMIAALTPLLGNEARPSKSLLLGASSLISTFCQNEKSCYELTEVKNALAKLESILGATCYSMGEEEEHSIIVTLKALRNIGILTPEATGVVTACYEDFSNTMEIRLAALDFAKSQLCSAEGRNYFEGSLKHLFKNNQVDSELRIGAYLSLMNCPTESDVAEIKMALDNEEVNQVGSFIWTHLTNLQETQSFSKAKRHLKALIGNDFLKNKWNTDVRKYSRYFETSYFAKDIDASTTAEGSLIFSQESYLPRSAGLNVSVNLFGENLNLFEIGARVEGFENVIEDMFGPDGKFREDTFHKVLQGIRGRRDVTSNEIANFQQTYNNHRLEEPKGNYYFRMFGKDIWYDSFLGMHDLVSRMTYWPTQLFSQKVNEVDVARSNIFLDGGIVVPTSAGFPLNLVVNGTYSASFKSSVTLETESFFKDGLARVKAEVYPTASVEVVGLITVEVMGEQKTGLKSTSRMISNSFLDGSVQLKGKDGVTAAFNMPKETVEALDVSVDFSIFDKDTGSFEELVPDTINSGNEFRTMSCSPSIIEDFLAVEACYRYQYFTDGSDVNGGLPSLFSGPSRFSVNFRKTDTFDRYAFVYQWNEEEIGNVNSVQNFRLSFNTPGAERDHKTSLVVSANSMMTLVDFQMTLPFKETKAVVKYEWTDSSKIIKAGLNSNRVNVLTFHTALRNQADLGRYGVKARMSYFAHEIIDWSGTLSLQKEKASLDGKMMGTFHSPLKVGIDWNLGKGEAMSFDVSVDSDVFTTKTSIGVKTGATSLNIDGSVLYRILDHAQNEIVVSGKYGTTGKGALSKHNIFISFNPLQNPELYSELAWDVQVSQGYIENNGKLKLGQDMFNFEQLLSSQDKADLQELICKFLVSSSRSGTEYGIDFVQRNSETLTNNKLALSYGKTFRFDTFFNHESSLEPFNYKLETGIKYPGREMVTLLEARDQGDQDYTGKALLKWGPEDKEKVAASFKFRRGNTASPDYDVKATLNVLDLDPLAVGGTLLLNPTKSLVDLNWSRGEVKYKLHLQHGPIEAGLESGALAVLKVDKTEYKAVVIYRLDSVMKAVKVDVDYGKKISTYFKYQMDLSDLEFNYYWDKDVDDTKRVLLKAKLQPGQISGEYDLLDRSGSLNAKIIPNGYKVDLTYDMLFFKTEVDLKNDDDGFYGIRAKLQSSIPVIKDVRVMIKYSLREQPGTGVSRLDSRVAILLNDLSHSASVGGEIKGFEKINVQFKTKSTHKPFHGFVASFDHELTSNQAATEVKAFNEQQTFFILDIDLVKTMEKGNLVLKTPYSILKTFTVSFQEKTGTKGSDVSFNYNDEHTLNAYIEKSCNHNDMALHLKVTTSMTPKVELMLKNKKTPGKWTSALTALYDGMGPQATTELVSSNDNLVLDATFKKNCPTAPAEGNLHFSKSFDSVDIRTNIKHDGEEIIVDMKKASNDGKEFANANLQFGSKYGFEARAESDSEGGNVEGVVNRGSRSWPFKGIMSQREYIPEGQYDITREVRYLIDLKENDKIIGTVDIFGHLGSGAGLKVKVQADNSFVNIDSLLDPVPTDLTKIEFTRNFRFDATTSFSELEQVKFNLVRHSKFVDVRGYKILDSDKFSFDVYKKQRRSPEEYKGYFLVNGVTELPRTMTFAVEGDDFKEHKLVINTNTGYVKVNLETPKDENFIFLEIVNDKNSNGIDTKISHNNPWFETTVSVEADRLHLTSSQMKIDSDIKIIQRGEIVQKYNALLTSNHQFQTTGTGVWVISIASEDKPQTPIVDMKASVQLPRPGNLGTLNLSVNISNGDDKLTSTKIDIDGQTGTLTGETNCNGKDYTLRVSMPEKTLSYTDPKLAIRGNINFEPKEYGFKVELTKIHFKPRILAAKVSLPQAKVIEVTGEYSDHWTGKREVTGRLDYSRPTGDMSVEALLDLFHKKFIMEGEFSITKGTFKAEKTRTWEGRKLTDNYQLTYNVEPDSGSINLVVDNKHHRYIKWTNSQDNIDAEIKWPGIESNVSLGRKSEEIGQTKLQQYNIKVTDKNEEKLVATAIISKVANIWKSSLKAKTPVNGLKNIDISLDCGKQSASLKGNVQDRHVLFKAGLDEDLKALDLEVTFWNKVRQENPVVLKVKLDQRNVLNQELKIQQPYGPSLDFILTDGVAKAEISSAHMTNVLEVTWEEGDIFITSSRNGATQGEVAILYNLNNFREKGEVKVKATATFMPYPFKMSDVTFKYNVANKDKSVDLVADFENSKWNHFHAHTDFQFSKDAVMCKATIKSKKLFDDLIVDYKLDIIAKPGMTLTYKFEGQEPQTVGMSFAQEGPVYTVRVSTPYPGFENFAVRSAMVAKGNSRQISIIVKKDDNQIGEWTTKYIKEGKTFELSSNLETPFNNWEELKFALSLTWSDPYTIRAKLAKNNDIFSLDGRASLIENELHVEIATPIKDYESIILSGKTGTTSIGKSMGVSFEHNRQRRDVALSYGMDEESSFVAVKTPLQSIKSLRVTNRMKRNVGEFEFDFEADGDNPNELALGVKYNFDFEADPTSGGLAIRFDLGKANLGGWEKSLRNLGFVLEFNNLATLGAHIADPSDARVAILRGERPLYEIKLEKGQTPYTLDKITWLDQRTLTVTTPRDGTFTLKTNYKNSNYNNPDERGVFEITTVRRLNRMADRTLDLEIGWMKKGGNIKVTRNGNVITDLKVEVDLENVKEKVWLNVDWEAGKNLWAKMEVELNRRGGSLKITSSMAKFKSIGLTVNFEDGISENTRTVEANLNDEFFKLVSVRTMSENGSSKSVNTATSNFPWIGFNKRVTTNEIINDASSNPKEWVYKYVEDGVKKMEIRISKISGGIEGSYYGPSYINNDTLEGKFIAKTDKKKLAQFELTTNIPEVRKLVGKGSFGKKGSNGFETKGIIALNGKELVKIGGAVLNMKKLLVQLAVKPLGVNQKIEAALNQNGSRRQLDIKAAGTGIDLVAKITGNMGGSTQTIAIAAKGNLKRLERPFDFNGEGSLEQSSSGNIVVNLKANNKRAGRQHELKLKVGQPSPRTLQAQLEVKSSLIEDLVVKIDLKGETRPRSFLAQINYGTQTASLSGKIDISKEASDSNIKLNVLGRQYVLEWVRQGIYKDVTYRLFKANSDDNDMYILINAKTDYSSPKEYTTDIKIQLNPLITRGYKGLANTRLQLKMAPTGSGRSLTGTLNANEHQVDIDYSREDDWSAVNLSMTSTTLPYNPVLIVKVEPKGNGRNIVIQHQERKVTIFGNLSNIKKLSNNDDIILQVTTSPNVNADAKVVVNRGAGTAKFSYKGKKGGEPFTIDWNAKMKTAGETVKVTITGERTAIRPYNYDATIDIDRKGSGKSLSVTVNKSGKLLVTGSIALEQKSDSVDVRVSLVNKKRDLTLEMRGNVKKSGSKRVLDLDVTANGNTLNLDVSWDSEGKLVIDVNSSHPSLKDFDLEVTFGKGKLKLFTEYEKEGSQPMQLDANFNSKKGESYSVKIKADNQGSVYNLNGSLDLQERKLQFESSLNGKTRVKIDSRIDGESFVLTFTSGLEGIESGEFKGKWVRKPDGAIITAEGTVGGAKREFEAEITRSEESVLYTWKVSDGAKFVEFSLNVKTQSVSSMEFELELSNEKSNLAKIKLNYFILDKFFHADLIFDIPRIDMKNGEAKFRIGFNEPRKLEVTAIAKISPAGLGLEGEDGTIFNVSLVLELAELDNIKVKVVLAVPALGLKTGSAELEVIFKVQSSSDFDVTLSISVFGKKRSYGIKRLVTSLDNGWLRETRLRLTGLDRPYDLNIMAKKTDGEFRASLHEKENNYIKLEGALTKNHGKRQLEINFMTWLLEPNSNSASIKANIDPKGSVSINVHAFELFTGELSLEMKADIVSGTIAIEANGETITKGSITMDLKPNGRFEIVLLNGFDKIRVRRDVDWAEATFSNPEMGDFDVKIGKDVTSGILVLKTSSGLHKLTYQAKDIEGVDFEVFFESPLLNQGKRVSIKVTLDQVKHNYQVNLESPFLETLGYFTLSQDGFATKLSSKSQLIYLLNFDFKTKFIANERKVEAYLGLVPNTGREWENHFVQLNFNRLDNLLLVKAVSTPHVDVELTGQIKTEGKTYFVQCEVKTPELNYININAEVMVESCKNFNGLVVVDGEPLGLPLTHFLFEHNMYYKRGDSDTGNTSFDLDVGGQKWRFGLDSSKRSVFWEAPIYDLIGRGSYEIFIQEGDWYPHMISLEIATKTEIHYILIDLSRNDREWKQRLEYSNTMGHVVKQSIIVNFPSAFNTIEVRGTIDANLPFIKSVERESASITFRMPDLSTMMQTKRGFASLSMNYADYFLSVSPSFDFNNQIEVMVECMTTGYYKTARPSYYEAHLALANRADRQALIVYTEGPRGYKGVKIDFTLESFTNFNADLCFRVPQLHWVSAKARVSLMIQDKNGKAVKIALQKNGKGFLIDLISDQTGITSKSYIQINSYKKILLKHEHRPGMFGFWESRLIVQDARLITSDGYIQPNLRPTFRAKSYMDRKLEMSTRVLPDFVSIWSKSNGFIYNFKAASGQKQQMFIVETMPILNPASATRLQYVTLKKGLQVEYAARESSLWTLKCGSSRIGNQLPASYAYLSENNVPFLGYGLLSMGDVGTLPPLATIRSDTPGEKHFWVEHSFYLPKVTIVAESYWRNHTLSDKVHSNYLKLKWGDSDKSAEKRFDGIQLTSRGFDLMKNQESEFTFMGWEESSAPESISLKRKLFPDGKRIIEFGKFKGKLELYAAKAYSHFVNDARQIKSQLGYQSKENGRTQVNEILGVLNRNERTFTTKVIGKYDSKYMKVKVTPASNQDQLDIDLVRISKRGTENSGKIKLIRSKAIPSIKGDLALYTKGRPFNEAESSIFFGLEREDSLLFNHTILEFNDATGDPWRTRNCLMSANLMENHILALDARWDEGYLSLFRKLKYVLFAPRLALDPIASFFNAHPLSSIMKKSKHLVARKTEGIGRLIHSGRGRLRSVSSRMVKDVFSSLRPFLSDIGTPAMMLTRRAVYYPSRACDEVLELTDLIGLAFDVRIRAFENISTRVTNLVEFIEERLEVGVLELSRLMSRAARAGIPDPRTVRDMAGHLGDAFVAVAEKVKTLRATFSASEAGKACLILSDIAKKIRGDAFKFFTEMSEFFKQFNLIRSGVQLYLDYQSWLEEIHFTQRVDNTLGEARKAIVRAVEVANKLKDRIANSVSSVASTINQGLGGLFRWASSSMEATPLGHLSRFMSYIFNQLIGSEENPVQAFLDGVIGQIDAVTSLLVRLLNVAYYGRDLYDFQAAYDAQVGAATVKVVLPLEWSSFQQGPKILKLLKPKSKGSEGQINMLSIQYDIMDAINTINTAIATKNVVPPFSAHAQIFGDNKIRTFDGQIYSFDASECEYLLTSDFLHNRFSVVANFRDGKRTHLTVMTDEGKTIDIHHDPTMKVTVDKRAINLPHHVQSSFIRREGNKVILENNEGLRIQCNNVHHTCSITVSGWYFGKTGGLLGIYDGEPSNDFMTPERKIVNSKDDFVSSWRVGEACTSSNTAPETPSLESTLDELDACNKMFVNESSPLLPCFTSIDPQKYISSCLQDMMLARGTDRSNQGICSSASAYIDLCKIRVGVQVAVPAQCATCRDESNDIMEIGATKYYEAPNLPRSADVVIIVEQAPCLRDVNHQDLPRLINQALEDNSIVNNRFAVVGYGGKAPFYDRHQTFTSAGEGIFASVEKAREALNSLKYRTSESSTAAKNLAYDTLQFAAQLNYRPAVSKNFVLLTCSSLADGSAYAHSLTMLRTHSIFLHHLTSEQVMLKSNKAKKTGILGYNAEETFSREHLSKTEGNRSLKRHLQVSKDYLTTLALESQGSVFTHSGASAKLARTALARQVARRAEPVSCQICDCMPDRDGEGHLQCQRCMSHEFEFILKDLPENY